MGDPGSRLEIQQEGVSCTGSHWT